MKSAEVINGVDLIRISTILVIDDDTDSLFLLRRLLVNSGCEHVLTSSRPEEALELYMQNAPDLVLLDLHMPGMSGIELMEKFLRFDPPGAYVPVIVITADLDVEAKREALLAGANDFIDKFSRDFEILLRVKNFLKTRHLHVGLAKQNLSLERLVYDRTKELDASQREVVQRLATAAEYRDDNTGKHVERVGNMAAELALAVGLDCDTVELVRLSAKLHDIGKIAIPDSILYKPGPLSADEREVMETHTTIGFNILSQGSSELTRTAQVIARSHHEKWNGKGYPDALVGEEIPMLGRLVAVADVYDALVSKRPYKRALSSEQARGIILRESGQHFDPTVVAAFADMPVSMLNEFEVEPPENSGWTLFDAFEAF